MSDEVKSHCHAPIDEPYDCIDEDYEPPEEILEEIHQWSLCADPGWDYWEDRPKLVLVDDPDGDEFSAEGV